MKKLLNKEFWSEQYQADNTNWNAGAITTPLKEYFDGIADKQTKILIPGVGHGHELLYLYRSGFTDVTAIDIAEEALQKIAAAEPLFPKERLIQADFFQHSDTYDLIVEQTFFCALEPDLRLNYVRKMDELLRKNGKLVGLLFDFCFPSEGPPFGGSLETYQELFSSVLKISKMERAYNSIKPRAGRELFIVIEKKDD
ncbi:methyltransferase [Flavobacterium sp. JP2137]|uniref:methyltransferase n=1 Tax=Flavobacterium sp. JP2137 TaxID=3414510 RepID=UPI003D2FA97B